MTSVVEIEIAGHGVILTRLHGDIDISRVNAIQTAIAASMTNDARGLIIDLSAVRHFDSSGIRLIFDVRRRLAHSRQGLGLVVPADAPVHRVFSIVNMQEHVTLYQTADAAVADLAARGSGMTARPRQEDERK